MFKFIRNIRNYFAQEKARHAKLEAMFQEGKSVKSLTTGKVFKVVLVDLGFVLLQSPTGSRFTLDCMTPAGTVRTDIADRWDPVIA